jgi:hypothetical protein
MDKVKLDKEPLVKHKQSQAEYSRPIKPAPHQPLQTNYTKMVQHIQKLIKNLYKTRCHFKMVELRKVGMILLFVDFWVGLGSRG